MIVLRKTFNVSFVLLGMAVLQGCSKEKDITPELIQEKSPSTLPALAKKVDVVDVIHGVEVHDPYRWLEDWQDPTVKSFSEAQNLHARQVLNDLPERKAVHSRIVEILKDGGKVSYSS